MSDELVTLLEIDMDQCGRRFGVAPCNAALSSDFPHKCYNTFATCGDKPDFLRTTLTLRFAEPRPGLPKGQTIFPALESVTAHSATVNIAGSDEKLSALGRRSTVTAVLRDFPYHDRLTDPYALERVTGAAQWGGVGYDPAARGTFFGKLRARWPHYFGRACRVIRAKLEGGALVVVTTRHYVLTDWAFDDDGRTVRIEAKDVLALADDARAVVPAPARGVLSAPLTATDAALTLTPAGIGATYPASGRANIGGELVTYTRTGDAVTLTGRGQLGTVAKAASAGDAFQAVWSFDLVRVDDAVELLLLAAGVPAAFIPKAEWAADVSYWMPSVRLRGDVTSPEGVAKLVGEISYLGVSIWWDDVGQKVRLRVNAPVDLSAVPILSEETNIKAAQLEDRQGDRLTEVYFYTVQKDPTKGVSSADNFLRLTVTVDAEAKDARAYGDTRARRVYSRWFNQGADGAVSGLSRRLLRRFRSAPIRVRATVDDRVTLALGDVARVRCGLIQDRTGATAETPMQVIQRAERPDRGEVDLTLQAFDFVGRYAFATENTRPSYAASSAAQRAAGFYACDPVTLKMPDGGDPYEAI